MVRCQGWICIGLLLLIFVFVNACISLSIALLQYFQCGSEGLHGGEVELVGIERRRHLEIVIVVRINIELRAGKVIPEGCTKKEAK
jgi:hypothetical protein